MATHASIPAWEILWTEEPGGLQSGQGVRHDLVTKQQHPCVCVSVCVCMCVCVCVCIYMFFTACTGL